MRGLLSWSDRHHNAFSKRWRPARDAGDGRLMMRIETACDYLHARSLRKCNRRPTESRRTPANTPYTGVPA